MVWLGPHGVWVAGRYEESRKLPMNPETFAIRVFADAGGLGARIFGSVDDGETIGDGAATLVRVFFRRASVQEKEAIIFADGIRNTGEGSPPLVAKYPKLPVIGDASLEEGRVRACRDIAARAARAGAS